MDLSDPVLCPRDKRGNRIITRGYSHVPITTDEPIAGTHLGSVCDEVAIKSPILADYLRWYHDKRLVSSIQRYARVLEQVRTDWANRNLRAIATNPRIEAQVEKKRAALEKATAEDAKLQRKVEAQLSEAHLAAGSSVACAGGVYLPDKPHEDSILRATKRPLEAIAHETAEPYDPRDATIKKLSIASGLLMIIPGALIGLSLGIFSHLLNLSSRQLPLGMILLCTVLGIGLACMCKLAIQYQWNVVGREDGIAHGQDASTIVARSRRNVAIACAVLGFLLLSIADLKMEQRGLMAYQELRSATRSLGRGSTSALAAAPYDLLATWVAPILCSLGLFICSAYEGYLSGRHRTTFNRLSNIQDREFRDADRDQRANPLVTTALTDLSRVRELMRQHRSISDRIAQVRGHWLGQINELEQQKLPILDELSEKDQKRLQDAHDSVIGAQERFDDMVAVALSEHEPSWLWWRREWWFIWFWWPWWRWFRSWKEHGATGGRRSINPLVIVLIIFLLAAFLFRR